MNSVLIQSMLLQARVKKMLGSEKGQGMVEYGLILALVSVVALVALGALGTGVNTTLESVKAKL